jgi:hypothetical protein
MLRKPNIEDNMDEIMVKLNVTEVDLCFQALVAAAVPTASPALATAMLALAARIRYRKQLAMDCICEQQAYSTEVAHLFR